MKNYKTNKQTNKNVRTEKNHERNSVWNLLWERRTNVKRVYMYVYLGVPVVYRRRNWTRRYEFKSWADCISHFTNTLGKGMNPIILPPTMGK